MRLKKSGKLTQIDAIWVTLAQRTQLLTDLLAKSSTSNRPVVYTLAHEHSSECARPARGPYHSGTGIDRSTLPKRLRASAPTRSRIGRVPLPATWTADRLACAPGADTGKFVAEIKGFAAQQAIPLFHFERKESKDLRAHQMRRRPKKASALKARTMGFLVARIH